MHENLREDAIQILKNAIDAVEPSSIVKKALLRNDNILYVDDHKYDLNTIENIYVIAFGKASVGMSRAVEDILSDKLLKGIAVTRYGSHNELDQLTVYEAAHPIPDENSIKAATFAKEILSKTTENDLIIFLISGGGSSLFELPRKDISFKEVTKLYETLLNSRATIKEINTVRKHLSIIKGGGLTKMAYPSQSVSLILSDVADDSLEIIASGPTVPDSSTFEDFNTIIERYNIQLTPSISRLLEDGLNGLIDETYTDDDPIFDSSYSKLIGNNYLALDAASKKAESLGYNALLLTSYITGESKEIVKIFSALARNELYHSKPMPIPACIIAGGESTVNIEEKGKGGRCQEMALSFAIETEGLNNILFLAAGTDGIDGPTNAAGATADGNTIDKSIAIGLNAIEMLEKHDSYPFFDAIEDLVIIGETGTNVMDIYILLVT